MGRGAPPKRACDRCHAIKEKCRWTNDRSECERCYRLLSPCQILRPLAKAGRRPRTQRTASATANNILIPSGKGSPGASSSASSDTVAASPGTLSSEMSILPRSLPVFVDLDEREVQFLNGVPLGQTRVDQFLIGPSFRKCHQEAFTRHLFAATPLIRDALIASSALIACEHELRPTHQDRVIGHRRAASAVSALRSLKLLNPADISTVLLLAISAVTFALHISGSSLAISRHSLHLVKPFYDTPAVDLDHDGLAFITCLINSETAECLFRGEVPTLRLRRENSHGYVDRFLGLASPMLSYLYDICRISSALRQTLNANRATLMSDLGVIEQAVDAWQPTLLGDYITRFSQTEIVSMVAQARVFRWSTLLIAHRLRIPYGSGVSKGTAISNAILEELDLTIQVTKRSVPCITVAFMAACFELTDPSKRQMALGRIDAIIEFSEQLRSKTKKTVSAFWAMRDYKDPMYWHDLPDLLPM